MFNDMARVSGNVLRVDETVGSWTGIAGDNGAMSTLASGARTAGYAGCWERHEEPSGMRQAIEITIEQRREG